MGNIIFRMKVSAILALLAAVHAAEEVPEQTSEIEACSGEGCELEAMDEMNTELDAERRHKKRCHRRRFKHAKKVHLRGKARRMAKKMKKTRARRRRAHRRRRHRRAKWMKHHGKRWLKRWKRFRAARRAKRLRRA